MSYFTFIYEYHSPNSDLFEPNIVGFWKWTQYYYYSKKMLLDFFLDIDINIFSMS